KIHEIDARQKKDQDRNRGKDVDIVNVAVGFELPLHVRVKVNFLKGSKSNLNIIAAFFKLIHIHVSAKVLPEEGRQFSFKCALVCTDPQQDVGVKAKLVEVCTCSGAIGS